MAKPYKKKTGYYYDDEGDLRFESGGKMYYDSEGDLRQEEVGKPYYDSEGDLRYENKVKKQPVRVVGKKPINPKKRANQMLKKWYKQSDARARKTERLVDEIKDASNAERKTSVQQYMEKTKSREAAGKAIAKQPVSGVANIDINAIKPLQDITGVALNSKLAGGNKATSAFYIPPSTAKSQFNVGGSTSAGTLVPRQKPSSTSITSGKDDLTHNSRKGRF